MNPSSARLLVLLALVSTTVSQAEMPLRQVQFGTNASQATIRIHPGEPSANRIPKFITGKFAEHLGFNIYNGMDAQILRNPTFADYPFWTGEMTADGVTKFRTDESRIAEELRGQGRRFGWPDSELADLVQAHTDALACFWARDGSREEIQPSADTGPEGGRAQRIQVKAGGRGIAQWTWLPLHRERAYEIELMVRSPDLDHLTVSIWQEGAIKPCALANVSGVSDGWQKLHANLQIPHALAAAVRYKVAITAQTPGQFMIRHAFLRPADHVGGADPDVVRFLKDAHLPLLRWPGGNFVSTYHWEDAVGPVEGRLTKPNYAWGAIEPNTFGTDEFMAFCRAVGCEPMICINAGSGTPKEAARWIEYCNGAANSPMGRLRAANGHPEPFGVKHWEIGNELWGHWQMNWTTPAGYVDRFKAFARAMLEADPAIHLYACGAPAMWGKEWNDALIAGAAASLGSITDHPLIGGNVPADVEPMDVYRDFMAVPEVLQAKWAALQNDMKTGGVKEPRLAVTELQLFAHLAKARGDAPARLTRETLTSQASITEAIYDVLIYHAAIRLEPFVELVTHSAVINHGGGLRKEQERVWAQPCYHAQAAFAAFGNATPVPLEIEAPAVQAAMVLPDLKHVTNAVSFAAIDALAARAEDGALLLSLVNRSSAEAPFSVTVDLGGFHAAGAAELRVLSGERPWSQDSDKIQPHDAAVEVHDGKIQMNLPAFSVSRLRVPGS